MNIIKFIHNFPLNAITTIFSSDIKRVVFIGRWSVPNSYNNTNIIINRIIDRNNEDHCGICISDDNNKKNIINEKDIEENNNYYLAFFM